ncbi:hypothetical protein DPMN_061161 [Dreissena polymorpha]|uniref:Uncharacterized protein n=1 Tax=Dreissena polymorpha TaxID=45954 RepID=A0A9D4C6H5_DREPO|nr:hypothetical protein DPMN_061161 [Dreissena polymorpha]
MTCRVKPDEISVYENKLEIDFDAFFDKPSDLDSSELYPVEVNADGNCLPSCGSVFAFGTRERTEKIRTRIMKELHENEGTYLSNEFLNRGCSSQKYLAKHYAQYLEFFIPGMALDQDIIKDIF